MEGGGGGGGGGDERRRYETLERRIKGDTFSCLKETKQNKQQQNYYSTSSINPFNLFSKSTPLHFSIEQTGQSRA